MVLGVPKRRSMNSGKIVAGWVDGTGRVVGTEIEGSIRGPRGPKNYKRNDGHVPSLLSTSVSKYKQSFRISYAVNSFSDSGSKKIKISLHLNFASNFF